MIGMSIVYRHHFLAGFMLLWWITGDNPPFTIPAPFHIPNTAERIQSAGYMSELHHIITEDGYNLTTFRIVRHKEGGPKPRPLILQHGLLCSSDCWVFVKNSYALSFLLADEGYDVWLTNSRGNIYSRDHVRYSAKSDKFWDFSFHEMGYYDLPATIDYILKETHEESLFYIGHSQGTAIFFVMASSRPEYNKKIRGMFALAPIAILDNTKGLVQALGRISHWLTKAAHFFNIKHILSPSVILAIIDRTLCRLYVDKCDDIVSYIVGFGSHHFNKELIPYMADICPSGASVKQFIHFFQIVRNGGKFTWFDYGERNELIYNSAQPPEYNLSAITSPIFLYYGLNDYISSVSEVKQLHSKLKSVQEMKEIANFHHLDFMWAKDAKDLLFDHMIEVLHKL